MHLKPRHTQFQEDHLKTLRGNQANSFSCDSETFHQDQVTFGWNAANNIRQQQVWKGFISTWRKSACPWHVTHTHQQITDIHSYLDPFKKKKKQGCVKRHRLQHASSLEETSTPEICHQNARQAFYFYPVNVGQNRRPETMIHSKTGKQNASKMQPDPSRLHHQALTAIPVKGWHSSAASG